MFRHLVIVFSLLVGFISNNFALDNFTFDNQSYNEFLASYPPSQRYKVRSILGSFEYKPKIMKLMTKPSEKLSWPQYKDLLISKKRINNGKSFMKDNSDILLNLYDKYGVPPRIITALIGIESSYGKNTGSWFVGDALKTLSFSENYRRANFFQSELRIFLEKVIAGDLQVSQKGSYAGAFGLTQFIPSSYQSYAVAYREKKKSDLNKLEDALASTASYLKRSGWSSESLVAQRVTDATEIAVLTKASKSRPKPSFNTQDYSIFNSNKNRKFAVLDLEGSDETWVGFDNFYAITRYNHSTNYAMVIYLISEELSETECELFGCLLS